MSRRKRLRDHVEFLAVQARRDCPFAASVLRSLAGAMDLDIDRDLSKVVLDWMIIECRLMGEQLDASCRDAGLPGYSFAEVLRANADPAPPRTSHSDN